MKRIVSGITPSGDGTLHIGNYLGAVKQFIEMAKTNDCFLFVADLHALTTIQDKNQLQKNVETLILNELALLGDLNPSTGSGSITFFRQSDIRLHPELQTILNNVTPLGLLKRAHAYKDKLQKDVMEDEINLGLFNYPILMAADILLYKADLVPVGRDQKQHVEITRDIAEKFNHIFKKNVFKLPDAKIPKNVASILGTDGKRKMSKSLGNIISIFESEEVIKKQVMRTYTDPTRKHATDPGHIEGNMVFSYLDHFGKEDKVDELKILYKQGKVSDVEVKEYLFSSLMNYFAPARKRYEELKNNPLKVREILEKGAQKAKTIAQQTMEEVREVIGLKNKYSFQLSDVSGQQLKNEILKHLPAQAGVQDDNFITIDEFAKVEVRVGKVIQATNVEKSEKLIKLTVDFKNETRTILTGVRSYGYTFQYFQDKQFLFVTNIPTRKMLGIESQGMILAVDGLELPFGKHGDKKPEFIQVDNLPIGAKVR